MLRIIRSSSSWWLRRLCPGSQVMSMNRHQLELPTEKTMRNIARYVVIAIALTIGSWQLTRSADADQKQQQTGIPTFQVDPLWPRMEGNWIFGSIGGITIDPTNDHVSVAQRPGTLDKDENYAAQTPPKGNWCVPAPPIMEFTPEGAFDNITDGVYFATAAGGAFTGANHAIFIDEKDVVLVDSG